MAEPHAPAPGTPKAPAPDPQTTLLMTDIALRSVSALIRRFVEKRVLASQVGTQQLATDIVQDQSRAQKLGAVTLSRIGTKSVPGALLVTGGLLAKVLFDRSQKARFEKRRKHTDR